MLKPVDTVVYLLLNELICLVTYNHFIRSLNDKGDFVFATKHSANQSKKQSKLALFASNRTIALK